MELSDRDAAILDLERTWFLESGSKEQAIRARLAMSPTRYYRLLGDLIDTAAAYAHDPLVVARLRRQRDQRRRARFERRPAGERPRR